MNKKELLNKITYTLNRSITSIGHTDYIYWCNLHKLYINMYKKYVNVIQY